MRILIVDDHALVRRGIAHVVRECFEDAEPIEAGSAAEAMKLMKDAPAEIALVDVRMPELNGLQLLRDLKQLWPDVPVIMLTTYEDPDYVRQSLTEGAAGYLLKDATPDDLGQAIRVALSGGGNVLSPRVIQNLFEEAQSQGQSSERGRRPESSLTRRETDILALLAEGMSNRDISRQLFLSEKTVKAHLAAIFRKLGVSNRTQAAMMAVSMGVGPRLPLSADAAGAESGHRT